jgi:hypothetical protein
VNICRCVANLDELNIVHRSSLSEALHLILRLGLSFFAILYED